MLSLSGFEGRNNLGVVSLNLPRIAIRANGSEAKFYELLNDRLRLARKALETRISRLENVKARVAPILYMEGACGVRLKADDSIADIFKNGRASISLGYIASVLRMWIRKRQAMCRPCLKGC